MKSNPNLLITEGVPTTGFRWTDVTHTCHKNTFTQDFINKAIGISAGV
jgi:hypothetical protein